jgi:hypothetical protein
MRILSAVCLVLLVLLGHYPATTMSQFPKVEKPLQHLQQRNEDQTAGGGANSNSMTTSFDGIFSMTKENLKSTMMIHMDGGNTSHMDGGNTNSTVGSTSDSPFHNVSTDSPTMAPRVPIDGYITLELVDTTSMMKPNIEALFVDISQAFLTFHIFIGSPILKLPGDNNRTFLSPLVDDEGLTVQMILQSRSVLNDKGGGAARRYLGRYNKDGADSSKRGLQNTDSRPLYVTLQVSAVARELSDELLMDIDIDVTSDMDNISQPIELISLDEFEFDSILQQIFIEHEVEYIEALQITGESFFEGIDQVNVLLESTVGDLSDMTQPPTLDHDKTPISDKSDDRNSPPVVPKVEVESKSSSTNSSFFTTPMIIGITVGGAVLLCLIVGCLWHCVYYRRHRRAADSSAAETVVVASGVSVSDKKTPKTKSWNRRRSKGIPLDGPVDSLAEQHLMRMDTASNRADEEASEVASDPDTGSLAMYSYNPRGDSGSVYTTNNSIMMNGGGGTLSSNHSIYGNDNSSYAYSLEPGIEASIDDGVFFNDTILNQSNMYDDGVPIREIPQISVDAGGSGKNKNGVSRSSDNELGDTHIETVASDLKLTPSELAMLPSNLRSGEDEEEQEGGDADSNGFPLVKKSTIKTILAPPGKLGIVIDTTVEGPVVHNVNQGSRLEGKIFPGDIIVAIDNVDTRAMSASAITALMVKTASQQRKLTVRRADPS